MAAAKEPAAQQLPAKQPPHGALASRRDAKQQPTNSKPEAPDPATKQPAAKQPQAVAEVSPPPPPAQRPKSLAVSDNEEQWQNFYKEARQQYGLTEAQATAADEALQSCLKRAAARREEHKEAVRVADQAKDAPAREKADATLRTALVKLGDESVGRIDAIASVEQVEKAAKAGFESPRRKNPQPKPEIGFPAPSFELKTQDNKVVTLDTIKGKVAVLHFFAAWCPHCKKSMPEMGKFTESVKDNPKIEVYGVSCSLRPNSPEPNAMVKEGGCNYQVILNGDAASKIYEVEGFPTLYVIGPDGKIIDKWRGEQSNVNARLDPIIKKALEDYEKQGKKS
ncbi:MAG TPA: TlpA disulfide reductase family protein [Phycisphaerae bacterium]|nr:TlpA disulfide reductase family protein [Phycisphaerae bacterium]